MSWYRSLLAISTITVCLFEQIITSIQQSTPTNSSDPAILIRPTTNPEARVVTWVASYLGIPWASVKKKRTSLLDLWLWPIGGERRPIDVVHRDWRWARFLSFKERYYISQYLYFLGTFWILFWIHPIKPDLLTQNICTIVAGYAMSMKRTWFNLFRGLERTVRMPGSACRAATIRLQCVTSTSLYPLRLGLAKTLRPETVALHRSAWR